MADNYTETAFVADALKASDAGEQDSGDDEVTVAANAVLRQLRRGVLPNAADAELMNGSPLIESMRRCVTIDDLDWICSRIEASGDQRSGLMIALLNPHAARPEVQSVIRGMWPTASLYIKVQLLWRLLDDPNLPAEWHARLFAFATDEREAFEESYVKFLGPRPEQVIIRSLERYGDPLIPQSKKWAYLCGSAGATAYPRAVQALLAIGSGSSDPFTRRAATQLLGRLSA